MQNILRCIILYGYFITVVFCVYVRDHRTVITEAGSSPQLSLLVKIQKIIIPTNKSRLDTINRHSTSNEVAVFESNLVSDCIGRNCLESRVDDEDAYSGIMKESDCRGRNCLETTTDNRELRYRGVDKKNNCSGQNCLEISSGNKENLIGRQKERNCSGSSCLSERDSNNKDSPIETEKDENCSIRKCAEIASDNKKVDFGRESVHNCSGHDCQGNISKNEISNKINGTQPQRCLMDGRSCKESPKAVCESRDANFLSVERTSVSSSKYYQPSETIERDGNREKCYGRNCLQPSSSSSGGDRNHNQRICEIKYAEYMASIFPSDDDRADANDSDFHGRTLAEPGEYPHMAALGYCTSTSDMDFKCGGSLISENFVITAAHCTNLTGQQPAAVRIGDLNLMVDEKYLEPQLRGIRRICLHPGYETDSYYDDIALLELSEDVEFTEFVRPIRLWVSHEIPYTTVHAMGYGATAFGLARTNRLTALNLTIVPNDDCDTVLPKLPEAQVGIIDSQICARDYEMNRDTCQGDSGGPLQLNLYGRRRRNRKHYNLVGITSYGLGCRSGFPGVYTRISAYLNWIEQIVWKTH